MGAHLSHCFRPGKLLQVAKKFQQPEKQFRIIFYLAHLHILRRQFIVAMEVIGNFSRGMLAPVVFTTMLAHLLTHQLLDVMHIRATRNERAHHRRFIEAIVEIKLLLEHIEELLLLR